MSNPTLFPTQKPLKPWQGGQDAARARQTDPGTSHAAASSVRSRAIRASQRRILGLLRQHGPMTDHALYSWLVMESPNGRPTISSSGARTRRAELAAMDPPLVEDSGQRARLPSGRQAIVWRAVP